mmetsp:Transcript_12409/g.20305  ORF Transcript_12409/g.20305 Transcript_12409/m.20305 type:complete len:231 (-) Transcript_12409:207-899(-)|eukprot:CAMPEP_0169120102 /NCGR_PEP_ID=MMETSP1015-20121227/31918_1 /TAXON_ID=342587 /ORGANISM="Karlodinium micrum, Strain CCMP2283" /LENGTH=230 /DNA_ID=CAMNT_0009183041 /DNA_START=59 /DNA_END=751 /DNA_ORIENTATION=-
MGNVLGDPGISSQPVLKRTCSAPEIPALMRQMATLFEQVDTENKEELDSLEIMAIIRDEDTVEQIIKMLDENGDRKISFSEFSAYYLNMAKEYGIDRVKRDLAVLEDRIAESIVAIQSDPSTPLAPQPLVRSASQTRKLVTLTMRMSSIFERVDQLGNGDGYVQRDELEKVLGSALHAGYLMKDMATTHEGWISALEWNMYFIKCFRTKGADSVTTMLNNLEAKLGQDGL